LGNVLKELKIGTINEEGGEKVVSWGFGNV
jgi:hypothetical protein